MSFNNFLNICAKVDSYFQTEGVVNCFYWSRIRDSSPFFISYLFETLSFSII